nr:MAG TPA: hypothetical protein [Caudoviricetes sp.]
MIIYLYTIYCIKIITIHNIIYISRKIAFSLGGNI